MRRQDRSGRLPRVRPWWRPLACSAATLTAIAALFSPLPAAAAPPAAPPAPAVPDTGSRPLPQGAFVLPGRPVAPTSPTTTTPISTPGAAMTPIMAKVEKGRAELTILGEQLTKAQAEVDLVTQQVTDAGQKVAQASVAVSQAQEEVAKAAAAAVREAAAMPPGSVGSGLSDLDSLARINRGDSTTQQAASRQLTIAQDAHNGALAEQQAAMASLATATAARDKLQRQVTKKTTAQLKLEQQYAAEIAASDAAQAARDAQAGADYLGGANAGRGADPRAIAALRYALAQRGDPYKWSEEGPDKFDCSGLMWAAYRSPGAGDFKLTRVSRDQYRQTSARTVDRYSLLPGDLLFFSSSSSWQQIHHVAMYAGNGMMVEAPRAGLEVRLVPVRWTRLFGATRIYGSIEGAVQGPSLGPPDPETPSDHNTTKPPASTTKPATKPPTTPATSKPTVKPTTPSTTPTTKPTTKPTVDVTTSAPAPTEEPSPTAATPVTSNTGANPETPTGSAANSSTKEETSGAASKSVSASAEAAAVAKSAGS